MQLRAPHQRRRTGKRIQPMAWLAAARRAGALTRLHASSLETLQSRESEGLRGRAARRPLNLIWIMPAKEAIMNVTLNPKAQASSHKIYVDGARGVRVPMRQIHLTDGTDFRVYDTSGAHSDGGAAVDVRQGLPPLRGP